MASAASAEGGIARLFWFLKGQVPLSITFGPQRHRLSDELMALSELPRLAERAIMPPERPPEAPQEVGRMPKCFAKHPWAAAHSFSRKDNLMGWQSSQLDIPIFLVDGAEPSVRIGLVQLMEELAGRLALAKT